MAERLQGAVRQLLQNYKETVHDKSPNCDRKQLLAAVEREDIVALKELKSSGIFSTRDIVRAAIDKDNALVVEEFRKEVGSADEVDGLGPLLDYSIQKRAMKVTRKFSGDFKNIGDKALPLFIAAIGEKDMDYVNQLLDKDSPVLLCQQFFANEGVGHLIRVNISRVELEGDGLLFRGFHLALDLIRRIVVSHHLALYLVWEMEFMHKCGEMN